MDQTNGAAVAAAGQRLGAVLRRHRAMAGLTQQALARQVGYSRSTIANAEAGDVRAGEFYRRCDATLQAGGAVTAAYRALGGGLERGGPAAEPGGRLARVPVEAAVEYLRVQWHVLIRTDNLLGPVAALPLALTCLGELAELLRTASGSARTALVGLSARYAEATAAICADAGRPEAASEWTGRSLEWAHELDDGPAIALALYRRGQLAAAGGEAARALSLARAALRQSETLPPAVVAAVRVELARAHALAGDAEACLEWLEHATAQAAEYEPGGDASAGYGSYCTRPWVGAQRGACALLLGTPEAAVPALEAGLAGLAPVYQRDRGLLLGWLAEAQARLGAQADAERTSARGLAIGEATGSVRVVRQARLAAELATALAV
jgi:transcriptional regulator with XRE-family HTH domain